VATAELAHELILGRYRPLRPLGSGGMGHVWLARDERSGLDVALKIVPREGKAAARAEREARAAAALRHPRCQRIYALARDRDHVYIAYEYIPGRTMRQALQAGRLDDADAVEVACQVLEALTHAHARGIVHRDVKPSNVLLAESAGLDVRLLDFGLAQMAEFDTLTAIGDVPGTLAYVSPERLLGQQATQAADVWAVGVMLWEALAGRHPFREPGGPETSRRIQAGAPRLETERPDLPRGLCRLVGSALALNPARRPSAAALAGELRRFGPRRQAEREKTPRRPLPRPRLDLAHLTRDRLVPSALAGIATAWIASLLPFYPAGWPLGLAVAAGALGLAAPRAGLVFALATALFPLANISLGLAVLYAALAAAWLALTWHDARAGLLAVVGPLLAPVAALGLLPLAAQFARGRARRVIQGATAVILAAVVAGMHHARLPLAGSIPPRGLGIATSDHPGAVAHALWRALATQPSLLAATLAIATATAALPYLRGRGPWAAAVYGAGFLAATLAAAPGTAVLPLVAAAWVTTVALALEPTRAGCS